MHSVAVIHYWRHLDAWDAFLFVLGLTAGAAIVLTHGGAWAEYAGWKGVVTGASVLTLRRVVQPSLLKKEAGPPPPPATPAVMLLTAFGIFGLFVTAAAMFLAFAMLETGPDQKPPLEVPLGFLGFAVVSGACSSAMIHFAGRRRARGPRPTNPASAVVGAGS
jgi:hypothetical protein